MTALGVIGRGRAATALVPRWSDAGLTIGWQVSRRDAADLGVLAPVDVVVLAVPDGALSEVAGALARRASAKDEAWLHLSGVTPASVLRVAPDVPRAVACLHPLVALADASAAIDGAVAGVEGEPPAVAIAEALARAAGLVPERLASGDARLKAAYHAAAVTVAGHATALFAQALALLRHAGFTPEVAQRALWPLWSSAVDNLARGTPAEVATGPIVRGDAGTVAAHLDALGAGVAAGALAPEVLATYRLLARTLLELVGARLAPEARRALAELLA